MRSKSILILFCLTPVFLSAAELEFVGYLRSGTETRFVVAHPEKGTTSSWITVGEKFQEFTITAFDAQSETLHLSRSGVTLTLQLKPSRVLPAIPSSFRKPFYVDVTPPGTMMIGQESMDLKSLEKRLAAAVAADPTIAVIVRANVEGDATWLQSLFRQVLGIARSVGARGTGLISKPPNKAPEPTTTSVTSPAAQEPRQP
jgi:biopolymer transport protein ExbD